VLVSLRCMRGGARHSKHSALPAWLGRPKRSVVHLSHLQGVRALLLPQHDHGGKAQRRGAGAHVMARAVLVRPADKLHGGALRTDQTTRAAARAMRRHLEVVANAVVQRLISLSPARQRRDDAPQRGTVGLNKRKPEPSVIATAVIRKRRGAQGLRRRTSA
jgi:hypothetical protein